jgi:pheromone shutdown protein TraB
VRLVILGVGHVFRIEEAVRHLITTERPPVVALELDAARYQSLLHNPPGDRRIPEGTPATYRRLAEFQQDVAESFGTDVGGEMRAAAHAAGAIGAQIVLVDLNAEDLIGRLTKEMGFLEKIRFGLEMLRARLARNPKKKLDQELERLETDPAGMIEELGRKYPTIKRVLLDERNAHMARRIRELVEQNGHVVAVIGDGHVPGVLEILEDMEPIVHRLRELRRMRTPQGIQWRVGRGGSQVSFAFNQEPIRYDADAGP